MTAQIVIAFTAHITFYDSIHFECTELSAWLSPAPSGGIQFFHLFPKNLSSLGSLLQCSLCLIMPSLYPKRPSYNDKMKQ